MLNTFRVNEHREALAMVRAFRTMGTRYDRKLAAEWLTVAGVIRRNASLPWDYSLTVWVCQCCVLSHSNGECCADDCHGGDFIRPLSCVKPEDTLADDSSEDDSSHDDFSTAQCDTCGTFLAGDRYRMTLLVNDRRNQPVSV